MDMAEELRDGDARTDYASRDELQLLCGASIRLASAFCRLWRLEASIESCRIISMSYDERKTILRTQHMPDLGLVTSYEVIEHPEFEI
jgi:hypothetical protein